MDPITPGEVTLSVADLSRSIDYYEQLLGLRTNERADGTARLGVPGRDLLVLEEQPGARPGRGDRTGLFHFAVLLPERRDLANWLAHAARNGVRLSGASDHFVSEAIYLRDPDAHGIEIYRDRPREDWGFQPDGTLEMGTVALDLDDLLTARDQGDTFDGMPEGTKMGHIHLHASQLDPTTSFYTDGLGFDLMVAIPRQATFLSTGGYHHHLGMNVWAGVGAPPPEPDQARLLRAAFDVHGGEQELDRLVTQLEDAGHEPVRGDDGILVEDPSRNPLLLRAA